jgi:probable HAF family extracellular repeat protein
MNRTSKRVITLTLILVISLILTLQPLSVEGHLKIPTITAKNIGALPGNGMTSAMDINDKGQVVGSSSNHAFIWTEVGGMKDLGINADYSMAASINAKGTVVGCYYTINEYSINLHAFLWSEKKGMQELGTLPGDTSNMAVDINDNEQVVGLSMDSNGIQHVFVWSAKNGLEKIEPLPEFMGANGLAINNYGQVVGSLNLLPDGNGYPFSWSVKEGVKELSPVFGTYAANARDIDNKGQYVGGYFPTPYAQSHSYLVSTTGLIDLGSPASQLGSQAYSINKKEQIVGSSWNNYFEERFGYYWDIKNGMILLEALPGAVFTDALQINNNGQAIGICQVNSDGETTICGVLWTISKK